MTCSQFKYRRLIKCFLVCLLANSIGINAKEGMWIPATLRAREAEMQKMGLSIPIEQLYNEDGTALNNAVVLFGRGCTGEIISSRGLLLTNHHCGYGTVQGLSDTINDYFAKGFFAHSLQEEKPCPGLTVTFIRKIINVTERITEGLSDTTNDKFRDSVVALRIKEAEKEYKTQTGMDALVKPYLEGNQFWMAISETFTDIRLVGFPPDGIGQFGGDDENWIWPRHTGDFSMFRVYAGNDNKPAPYAATNQPYNATAFFKINTGGFKEGDMTMVYGFPGTTAEYISSYELKQVYNIYDPIAIAARTVKLGVWSKHMAAKREVYIKYTSKRAGVANGWKKWQGELKGLRANNTVGRKQQQEGQFARWAATRKAPSYARHILPALRKEAAKVNPLLIHEQHIKEEVIAIELINQSSLLEKFIACFRAGMQGEALKDTLTKLAAGQASYFKNYDAATDADLFKALMPLYLNKCAAVAPRYYTSQYRKYGRNAGKWAKALYAHALLASEQRLQQVVAHVTPADSVLFVNDPAWRLYEGVATLRKTRISPAADAYRARKKYWNRLYVQAQMLQQSQKSFYPDANLTLRLAYGQVKGLDPEGKPGYSWQTYLSQAVALDNKGGKNWYKVPARLKELYRAKDFGQWAVSRGGNRTDVPLAFIASNHTSGGNSGSPVLNSRGELIGTNFDRAYEGTMSDYQFDPRRCRNITLDIRYTLFIVEKFGDAGWLLNEMVLVK
ncbi:MAG: S46 family peptidase [Chitinophagia bacterium]|nr:S46 family peptidase [Chitinophagia bacterium]